MCVLSNKEGKRERERKKERKSPTKKEKERKKEKGFALLQADKELFFSKKCIFLQKKIICEWYLGQKKAIFFSNVKKAFLYLELK